MSSNNDQPMKSTAEGNAKIEAWKEAQKRLERARREVNSAECDLANATNALGKWLMPPDAKQGEKIAIWYVDSLVEATMVDLHSFEVSLRYRGREWGRR